MGDLKFLLGVIVILLILSPSARGQAGFDMREFFSDLAKQMAHNTPPSGPQPFGPTNPQGSNPSFPPPPNSFPPPGANPANNRPPLPGAQNAPPAFPSNFNPQQPPNNFPPSGPQQNGFMPPNPQQNGFPRNRPLPQNIPQNTPPALPGSSFPGNPQQSPSNFPPAGPRHNSFIPRNPQQNGVPPRPPRNLSPNPQSAPPQQTSPMSSLPQSTNPQSTPLQQTSPIFSVPQSTNPVPAQSTNPAPAPTDPNASPKQDTGFLPLLHRTINKHKHFYERTGDPLGGHRILCLFNNMHFYRNGFRVANIPPHLCTHINYEFARLDPKTYEITVGEPDLDIDMGFYQEAIDLKKENPSLKVLLSLGGWADSTKKYSELAADPDKRANFIPKTVDYLKENGFDGLDFAWEYPNCWQGAIGINPADKQNFITLLQEMKPEFEKNDLLLSASVGAIKREIEAAYDVKALSDTVDYINVMTYDMHGPWEGKTGHHGQFHPMPQDSDPYANVEGGMKVWVDGGADKTKLNMGLAYYAKSFTLKDKNQNGMGAPTIGIGDPGPVSDQGGFLLYNEICQFLNSGNWTQAEDKYAGFYAYFGDQWACYDPPLMMVRKVKYVMEQGFGGVLMKDMSGDDYEAKCFSMPFPLTKMIRMEMMQMARRMSRAKTQ